MYLITIGPKVHAQNGMLLKTTTLIHRQDTDNVAHLAGSKDANHVNTRSFPERSHVTKAGGIHTIYKVVMNLT